MKFHKIISRTIVATALLGATLGGAFSGISASADSNLNQPVTSHSASEKNYTPGTFNVKNGLLTLDNIPNLNFVNSDNNSSNTLKLDNNNNNNNSGLLEVTDYRNNDKNNNDWSLTADMGNVNQNVNGNQQNINNQWRIDLLNQQNNEAKNLDNNSQVPNLNNTTLTNNTQNQPVMGMSSGNNNGYGVNQIKYDNANDAQLTIPNVKPGQYSTSINWKLSTTVDEGSN